MILPCKVAASRTLGISEAFNLNVTGKYGAGDWIEVTLHNAWNPEHLIPYLSYLTVPLDKEYTPSMRISLNLQENPGLFSIMCANGIKNIYQNAGFLAES